MNWWIRFKQSFYPAEFRIAARDDANNLALMIARLVASTDALTRPSREAPTPDPSPARPQVSPSPPPSDGIAKGLAIDLCNQMHRVSKSLKRIREQGGPAPERLKADFDGVVRILAEHSLNWEDLTGQAYDAGGTDFDPLGEPQVVDGLARKTIVQCERPVVRLRGEIIQTARGIVGKPPE